MELTCIIVEDEPLAMERTQEYVSRLPYLRLAASFNNGGDALAFLRSGKTDLVFLDINMDGLSGIQLLESAKVESEIIITTAYDEYALKGFELNVTDYLLKPYTYERFLLAVERARTSISRKTGGPEKKFIFIKTEYRLERVFLEDLIYIEGMRDYRRIHTTEKRIMTLQTFRELEEQIPRTIVCRVHKSFMVALGKIESVERDRIRIRDLLIPVSDTYKKDFLDLIQPPAR